MFLQLFYRPQIIFVLFIKFISMDFFLKVVSENKVGLLVVSQHSSMEAIYNHLALPLGTS